MCVTPVSSPSQQSGNYLSLVKERRFPFIAGRPVLLPTRFARCHYSCCYKWQNAPESATRRESRPGIEPVAQSHLTKPEISSRHARSNKTASSSRNLEDVQVQLKFDLAHLLHHIMMTRALPEIHMHRVTSPPRMPLDVLDVVSCLVQPSRARNTARMSSDVLRR